MYILLKRKKADGYVPSAERLQNRHSFAMKERRSFTGLFLMYTDLPSQS
jgi:hypothetical protein